MIFTLKKSHEEGLNNKLVLFLWMLLTSSHLYECKACDIMLKLEVDIPMIRNTTIIRKEIIEMVPWKV